MAPSQLESRQRVLPATLTLGGGYPPAAFLRGESTREDACSGPGHRWRRRRRQHALSPDEEGLDGRGADRAHRAHRRLHLARRRPPAAVQHELHRRPAAQVLGRPLQAPAGGDRPGCELSRHRQPAPRHLQGAHGRVPEVLRHGQHHRRALRGHHAQARARSCGRWSSSAAAPTRPPSSARSIIPTTATSRRPTSPWRCARARARAAPRSTSRPRRTAIERTAFGRVAACTRTKGDIIAEHLVLRHRQLRPPDRAAVRFERARDSGRAPVHRLRRVPGAQSLPPGRRARARGAARVR